MISYIYGAEYGQLHYRALEQCKIAAVWESWGNYDCNMKLNAQAINDIKWWLDNIDNQVTFLIKPEPTIVISTDSSKFQWGAKRDDIGTGGHWNVLECEEHINILEIKAILLGIKALCPNVEKTHIRVNSDNATAVAYVNKKGGCVSRKCNELAKLIWEWCLNKQCYISVNFTPGHFNIEADYLSRNQSYNLEWSLSLIIYQNLIRILKIKPTIDLFASRINNKVSRFVSFQPDPESICVDTFMYNFKDEIFYAFPPFNLIHKFLKKVILEELDGIIIAPCWPSQNFYPLLLNLLIDFPIMLKWTPTILSNPNRSTHPLGKKLKLMGCRISGKNLRRKAFHQKLLQLCLEAGLQLPLDNILPNIRNGWIFVQNTSIVKLVVI